MKYNKDGQTFLLVLVKGEDIVEVLTQFAMEQEMKFGSVSGIGACDNVTLNFYNLDTQKYEAREVNEALELTSLLGNISHIDDKPFAHLHGTFGTRDFQTLSGHLTKAVVSATAEIVIQMTNLDVNRTHDEETGLNLLRP
ncbi:MAG: PPC domain-containing DNA-binding protein [Staphylococcus haemolyticus]|uniref:DNA-binding protein n=2 Tax=Staphylococcus haemolyticus TaxID=1283 RepID=A0ABU3IG76_STAHA|nr:MULTISPECIES: PPC domain-containing DNA-binding protein [Staphylococcus]MDU2096847.1 PPC domain-containing DNA-binding protein [Staphylococcus sp.]AUV68126.1 DUF296 domain-containing protein [Staphylococcus haemolyticus]AUV70504.1 DUF296 domain-containing protein [Staphylococcus haemolyticus]KKI58301.1 hypothetical protein UF69_1456 [Staphylococcus haemolyticus]MBE7354071.1 DNA-binding protein [Staphylococcus haemolyticus]